MVHWTLSGKSLTGLSPSYNLLPLPGGRTGRAYPRRRGRTGRQTTFLPTLPFGRDAAHRTGTPPPALPGSNSSHACRDLPANTGLYLPAHARLPPCDAPPTARQLAFLARTLPTYADAFTCLHAPRGNAPAGAAGRRAYPLCRAHLTSLTAFHLSCDFYLPALLDIWVMVGCDGSYRAFVCFNVPTSRFTLPYLPARLSHCFRARARACLPTIERAAHFIPAYHEGGTLFGADLPLPAIAFLITPFLPSIAYYLPYTLGRARTHHGLIALI